MQRRWDRVAPLFDRFEAGLERRALQWWRRRLWAQVEPGRILEVGAGTGKNIPYYPPGAEMVAIDLSPRMVEEARKVAAKHRSEVDLRVMDAQRLDFPDDYFDAVVTSCVFCTVPNAALGMSELHRVLKPGHRAYFLEHVLSDKWGVRRAMKGLSRVTVRMMGDHLTRRTCAELAGAGFELEMEEDLWLDVIKLCVARKPERAQAPGAAA